MGILLRVTLCSAGATVFHFPASLRDSGRHFDFYFHFYSFLMRTFCTIITTDFIYHAIALYKSWSRFAEIPMQVLIVDQGRDVHKLELPEQVKITYLDSAELSSTGKAIVSKYREQPDILRWSLKPVWLKVLLSGQDLDKAIFVDPDLYFYADPQFLFDELDHGPILLSPHWRSSDPELDAINFELNFRDGMFNGGFLGASREGIPALDWLAKACLYKCEINHEHGLFLDQKYFDLLPVRFPGTRVLRHRGCNLANWNQVECRREKVGDTIFINGKYPVVFIHFTRSTLRGIRSGADSLLMPFLDEYESVLKQLNPTFVSPYAGEKTRPWGKRSILQRAIRKVIPWEKKHK
jgi:hypothetical protein